MATDAVETAVEVEHGAEDAYYSNLPRLSTIIKCLCGYTATAWTDSWEDAGREMDDHLAEARR